MYQPEHFKVVDRVAVDDFIRQYSFGQLISQVEGRPFVSHIPFLLDADTNQLLGHLARPNPQWHDIEDQEVLVTLQGPHAYVSPSWYQNAGVPTWNYRVVHIYARATVLQDRQEIAAIVERMTQAYEAGYEQPWQIEYPKGMLNSIVGLRLDIVECQAKDKLSQNRSIQDQKNVAERFESAGEAGLARAMHAVQQAQEIED